MAVQTPNMLLRGMGVPANPCSVLSLLAKSLLLLWFQNAVRHNQRYVEGNHVRISGMQKSSLLSPPRSFHRYEGFNPRGQKLSQPQYGTSQQTHTGVHLWKQQWRGTDRNLRSSRMSLGMTDDRRQHLDGRKGANIGYYETVSCIDSYSKPRPPSPLPHYLRLQVFHVFSLLVKFR